MTSGGPDGASETVLSYLYKQLITTHHMDYGMAIAAVVFIFSFILSFIINRATERDTLEL